MTDTLKAIEQGITDLDEAIDAVVGEMLDDPRLQDGGAYVPVGGERGLVELAGQVLTPLRTHWPQIVAVVEAAEQLVRAHADTTQNADYFAALDTLRSALSGLAGRGP